MPQLHLYLPDPIAEEIKRRAKASGVSTSRYLADIVSREVTAGWPEDFFTDVVGGWEGVPLVRAPQGDPDRRDTFQPAQGG